MRSRNNLWNLCWLAALCLLLAAPAQAGNLVITSASRTILPLSGTHVRVLGESWASYSGTLDPNQTHWSINAHVRDDSDGQGFLIGAGLQGVGIQQVMYLHCDPNVCGADKAVARCRDYGSDNTFTVRGAVATFFSNGTPIINNLLRAPEYVLCFDREREPPTEESSSPLIIDLDRNGFHLTGLDDPVLFDIQGDGVPEMLGWTAADQMDAFLALDVDRNGRIDDGSELFGNYSWRVDGTRATHGYQALAEYDAPSAGGNDDGLIDPQDVVFPMLRLWIDADHDGVSDDGELFSLAEVGITRLELSYKEHVRRDQHGNELVYQSVTWAKGPGAAEVKLKTTDVFLVNNGLN